MLEGLKKFVNWNNGTITELYDFIAVSYTHLRAHET